MIPGVQVSPQITVMCAFPMSRKRSREGTFFHGTLTLTRPAPPPYASRANFTLSLGIISIKNSKH